MMEEKMNSSFSEDEKGIQHEINASFQYWQHYFICTFYMIYLTMATVLADLFLNILQLQHGLINNYNDNYNC